LRRPRILPPLRDETRAVSTPDNFLDAAADNFTGKGPNLATFQFGETDDFLKLVNRLVNLAFATEGDAKV
jgi:hypothetical protein